MPFVGQANGKGVYGRYHSVISNFATLIQIEYLHGYLDKEQQARFEELEALMNQLVSKIPVDVYVEISGRKILLVNEL